MTKIMPRAGAGGDRWVRREPLAGDASTRRYSRLTDRHGRTAILAEYPPGPRAVLDRDLEAGRILLEDLGAADAEATLRSAQPGERPALAAALLAPLEVLAAQPTAILPGWNRPLDAGRLRWELAGFELWFVRHRQGVTPNAALDRFLDDLAEEVAGHPRRICHRDYHLNNLYLVANGAVAVIDAQDALVGPDTYDAVSLLEERAMPELLADDERHLLRQAWAQRTSTAAGWARRWPRVRAQRALKVLGTFARLEAAGRSGYTGWMTRLAANLAAEADSLGLPGEVVDRLLDLEG